MKVYFYSHTPALVKYNGFFIGKIGKNLTSYNCEENCLLEFIPTSDDYIPISVYNFTSSIVKRFSIYNELLLYVPSFKKNKSHPYKIIKQENFTLSSSQYLLTVLLDGVIKFYINGNYFATGELPFIPTTFKVEEVNDLLFISFVKEKTCLFIYRKTNTELTLVYSDIVENYSYQNSTLKAYKNYPNLFNLEVTEIWEYSANFNIKTIISNLDDKILSCNDKVKGYLFLSLIILNVDVKLLLSSELKEKSSYIKEFLDYPYLVTPFPSGNYPNDFLILTNKGAKRVNVTISSGYIESFSVDDC